MPDRAQITGEAEAHFYVPCQRQGTRENHKEISKLKITNPSSTNQVIFRLTQNLIP